MAFVPERARPDVYISADVETDGPIPGEFSMLSFALAVAGRYDGERFEVPAERQVFYVELKPISERFDPEALAVNGLDRDRLRSSGEDPTVAMRAAADWVSEACVDARPVLVAYPVAFDWAFLYWYFIRFAGDSPFGFSSCLDIRTLYQARALTTHDRSSKAAMPPWLWPSHAHTHHAADDAVEQAELFANVFKWALGGGGPQDLTSAPSDPPAPHWLSELVGEEHAPSRGSVVARVVDIRGE